MDDPRGAVRRCSSCGIFGGRGCALRGQQHKVALPFIQVYLGAGLPHLTVAVGFGISRLLTHNRRLACAKVLRVCKNNVAARKVVRLT